MTQVSSEGGKAEATVNDRTGLYISIIALILSAMALGAVIFIPQVGAARYEALAKQFEITEREARLLELEVHGMKNALHAHGIKDVNPHLPGEPD